MMKKATDLSNKKTAGAMYSYIFVKLTALVTAVFHWQKVKKLLSRSVKVKKAHRQRTLHQCKFQHTGRAPVCSPHF